MTTSAPHTKFVGADIWLPAPIDEVWAFFTDSQNLAKLTPASYGLKVNGPGLATEGSEVEISLAPFGIAIPYPWISKISDIVSEGPQRKFVDTQVRGPFALWRHEHLFASGVKDLTSAQSGQVFHCEPAGTWVRDRISYQFPLGEIVNKLAIKNALASLLAHRREKLSSFFRK